MNEDSREEIRIWKVFWGKPEGNLVLVTKLRNLQTQSFLLPHLPYSKADTHIKGKVW